MLRRQQTKLLLTFVRNQQLKQHLVQLLIIACPHALHRFFEKSIDSRVATFVQEFPEFLDALELGLRLLLHLFLNENYLLYHLY